MVKITTIIAAFNVEDYLDDCLTCLVKQSLPLFEIIVVDDGSTDSTPQKLKKWVEKHKNIKVIHQANSGGPGSPRNNGLENATGDYIHFMDPDDLLDNDFYEKLAGNIEQHKSEMTVSRMEKFNSKRYWIPKTFKKVELFDHNRLTNIIKSPELIQNLSSTNKIFRKDFLLKNNLFFLTGGASEEIHFTTCCYYLAEKIYINTDVNYYWRRRESTGNLSMSQKKSEFKSVKDRLESYCEIDEFLNKWNLIQYRYIKDSRAILDFLRHGNNLFEFEKQEQKQFFELVNNYLDLIDTRAYNYLPEYARQYFLTRFFFLRNKLGYELVASSTTKNGYLPAYTIYENNKPKVIFDFNYLKKKYGTDLLFPRNVDVPKRLINGQASLKKAILNNKFLYIEGYGYIDYLNVTSVTGITIYVTLKGRNSGKKLTFPTKIYKSPGFKNTIHHDYCGFKTKVPFDSIQNNLISQTIDVSLDIVIDGISRNKSLSADNNDNLKNKSQILDLYLTDKNNLSIKTK